MPIAERDRQIKMWSQHNLHTIWAIEERTQQVRAAIAEGSKRDLLRAIQRLSAEVNKLKITVPHFPEDEK